MTPHMLTRSLDRGATTFLAVVAACGILIPLSNLLLPTGSFLHVPTYLVALLGKYVIMEKSMKSICVYQWRLSHYGCLYA